MIQVIVLSCLATTGVVVLVVLVVGVRNKIDDALVETRVLEERREESEKLTASVQLPHGHHEQASQERTNPKRGSCTIPNIGLPELLIILLIALLLFGDSRLTELGKGVGRSTREFKEEVKSAESPDQDKNKSFEPEVVRTEIVNEKVADLGYRRRELEAREQALKEAELKAREAALNAREAETGN